MTNCTPAPHPFPTRLLATPRSCEMLAGSGTVVLWMHQLIWHAAWRPHANRNRTVHMSDSPIFWCVPILPISDLRIGITLVCNAFTKAFSSSDLNTISEASSSMHTSAAPMVSATLLKKMVCFCQTVTQNTAELAQGRHGCILHCGS